MGFSYQDLATAFVPARPDDFENREYRDASHGAALKQAGVAVRFIRVPGGAHGPNFRFPSGDPRLPDHIGEAVRWFELHFAKLPANGQ